MLKKIFKESMGASNLGWLESRFHFSFAEYFNPNNMNFGVLRVLNDDIVHPMSGFDTHPHSNMEIISYVVNGEITHKDSMGHEESLKRGEVQYMSAGDGILHSEHNLDKSEDLRLLQIWIIPPKNSLPRLYGSHRFKKEQRVNTPLHIVSNQDGNAPIKIYQDVNIYVYEMDCDKSFELEIKEDRELYFVQIEGKTLINEHELEDGDAMEIVDERVLKIEAKKGSHSLYIEMQKS